MPIAAPEDMAKSPSAAQHLGMTSSLWLLGDVAELTFSHAPLIGDAFVNNGNGLTDWSSKVSIPNTLEVRVKSSRRSPN